VSTFPRREEVENRAGITLIEVCVIVVIVAIVVAALVPTITGQVNWMQAGLR